MMPLLIIALVACVLLPEASPALPVLRSLPSAAVLTAELAPMLVIIVTTEIVTRWCSRGLGRTGHGIYVHISDWTLTLGRVAALGFHAAGVLVFGWLDLIRGALGGDVILIDEALATAPPLVVIVAGWLSYHRIDRQIREATIHRLLHTTGYLPEMPGGWRFAWEQARFHLLIGLMPIVLVLGWAEIVDFAAPALEARMGSWGEAWRSIVMNAVHFVGPLLAVLLSPLMIRVIWTTVPLGPGDLRDRLLALCAAQGVRCRELLVWRTHLNMLNGAVIGLIPRLRYILLTDALLERLPLRLVEAVMAHEIAHARKHHLPWLMLSVVVIIGWGWTLGAWAIDASIRGWAGSAEGFSGVSLLGGLVIALVLMFAVYGWISRRFEEQADACAAQHLSGLTRDASRPDDILITPEAAGAMASALEEVALHNAIPPDQFSWKHGSIASRQLRLARLAGRKARRLPIDATVDAIRAGILLGLVAMIATSWT